MRASRVAVVMCAGVLFEVAGLALNSIEVVPVYTAFGIIVLGCALILAAVVSFTVDR